MTLNSIIESVRANGYMANIEAVEGVEHVHVGGSKHEYFYLNPGDYASDTRQYMRDAVVCVAVLQFSVDEASPLSDRFIAELVKLVAPADRLLKKHVRPLVRATPTSLHAVYSTHNDIMGLVYGADYGARAWQQMFEHGLAFSDANRFSTGTLRADCGPVALDGGTWLADRTPLTVPRAELPPWDGDGISKKLREFVDRFIAAGEMCEREAYRAPPPKPDFTYGALDISVDPRYWDPTDPRHQIPGVADEVRRLRTERGLKHWE